MKNYWNISNIHQEILPKENKQKGGNDSGDTGK